MISVFKAHIPESNKADKIQSRQGWMLQWTRSPKKCTTLSSHSLVLAHTVIILTKQHCGCKVNPGKEYTHPEELSLLSLPPKSLNHPHSECIISIERKVSEGVN